MKSRLNLDFFSETSSGSLSIKANLQEGGDSGEGNRTKLILGLYDLIW